VSALAFDMQGVRLRAEDELAHRARLVSRSTGERLDEGHSAECNIVDLTPIARLLDRQPS